MCSIAVLSSALEALAFRLLKPTQVSFVDNQCQEAKGKSKYVGQKVNAVLADVICCCFLLDEPWGLRQAFGNRQRCNAKPHYIGSSQPHLFSGFGGLPRSGRGGRRFESGHPIST